MPVPPPSNAKRILHGKMLDFWQWEQEMFDGTMEIFECITRQDAATVIPFLDPQTVLLTQQKQPHRSHPFFDFPGGRIEPDEDMRTAAVRELQEETGYTAQRWCEWHRLSQQSVQRFEESLFLATDISATSAVHQDPGEDIQLRPTPWDELVRMCLKRQLRQPNIMLAVLAMEFDPEAKQRLRDWLSAI